MQIRQGTFETNSSSVHSIAIRGESLLASREEVIIKFGEYGWGYEELRTPSEKASYVLTYIAAVYISSNWNWVEEKGVVEAAHLVLSHKYSRWLRRVIKDYTGKDWDVLWPSEGGDFGYVDGQSHGNLEDGLGLTQKSTKEEWQSAIKNLIFDNSRVIIIDNDNH